MEYVDDRFFALTPERVLSAIELDGRRATGYALALNSLENRVYELELEDESRVVLKFYRPHRWSREAILDEHRFLRELADDELPVVPPMELGGSTLRRLGDEEIYYAAFPRVRGRVPDELADAQLAQLGRLLARLHNVGGRAVALHRPELTPATYGTAAIDLLEEGPWIPYELARPFIAAARELVARCAEVWGRVAPVKIRLQGDCHLGNLLWGSAGPFLLDFDDFLHGPAVQDLWLLLPGRDAEAMRQLESVVTGYEALRDFDRRTLALIEPLRALRILRYSAWIAQRWSDPAFVRAFGDFTEHSYWQRELAALQEQLEVIAALPVRGFN
jgi:Ser/Thr protein kinase RdoA (MazF antagonist)